MLLYIVYGILFVDTVDMKIKAHNALHYEDRQYTGVCGSYTTPYAEYYEVWKHQYQQFRHSIAFDLYMFQNWETKNVSIPISEKNSFELFLNSFDWTFNNKIYITK